jgi:transcription elongation factor Elf1
MKVTMVSGKGNAVVQCGSCKIKEEFTVPSSLSIVDIYCMFTDKYYGNRVKPESE